MVARWRPDFIRGQFTRPRSDVHRLSRIASDHEVNLRILNLESHQVAVVPGSNDLFSPRWSPALAIPCPSNFFPHWQDRNIGLSDLLTPVMPNSAKFGEVR
jgi:hypothetical protein